MTMRFEPMSHTCQPCSVTERPAILLYYNVDDDQYFIVYKSQNSQAFAKGRDSHRFSIHSFFLFLRIYQRSSVGTLDDYKNNNNNNNTELC